MALPRELFYDLDGKLSDALIHDAILEAGDHIAAFASTYNFLRMIGWSNSRIEEIYPREFGALSERNALIAD